MNFHEIKDELNRLIDKANIRQAKLIVRIAKTIIGEKKYE